MYFVKRGYRTNVRAYWEIPGNVFNAVLGSLLTKNSVELRSSKDGTMKTARLCYAVSENREGGFELMWELLSSYSSTKPALTEHEGNKFAEGEIYVSVIWRFKTTFMPCFTRFHELFYRDGVKRIPLNIVELMNAEVLAYWFLFSGLKYHNQIVFLTEGLRDEDRVLLVKALRKLGLIANVNPVRHTEGARIILTGHDFDRFNRLVEPYL